VSSEHGDPRAAASRGAFATTKWALVHVAQDKNSPHAATALEALCRAYWPPLYGWARSRGLSPHDAQDLTQAFFARLLEKDWLAPAQSEKGRFRTFLLVAFKRFSANEWNKCHAQKRGGGTTLLSIDQEYGESRFAAEPAHRLQPDLLYDRQWAVTLLERTMSKLDAEYVATGRSKLFEFLRPCLGKEESALPYAEIAAQLKLTEAAVKTAVYRMRARYREILRAEIADTVSSPEEVDEEIQHLFSAFDL
jgi:RNA polymerase sigma factor (sigma-70 family)